MVSGNFGRVAALLRGAAARQDPDRCEKQFFIDDLLVRIHFIIVIIKWTGLAPWEFGFPFPGSPISTFLAPFSRQNSQNGWLRFYGEPRPDKIPTGVPSCRARERARERARAIGRARERERASGRERERELVLKMEGCTEKFC
jgi:hypothetical protein